MGNAEKILDKIRDEKIKPKPKWQFLTSKALKWGIYILFILIGGIAFSVILYTIQQSEFNLLTHFNHSALELLLVLAPILWLIILMVFVSGSIFSARNTDRGYKLTFNKWMLYSTGLSMLIGSLFFITGGAQWFETSFANEIEFYDSIHDKKVRIWSDPKNGNLSGSIQEISENSIIIHDFNGKKWNLIIKDSFIAPRVLLELGERIKTNGKMKNDSTFISSHLRPWGQMGNNRGKKNSQNERK